MTHFELLDAGVSDVSPADVLVVDDTPANLTALEAALDGLAYRLVKASSGEEALKKVLARDFALILLDVQMPRMSGLESARLIRQRDRSKHTPIIFITGQDRDDDSILEAYRLGAVDFLFKPIEADILRAKAHVLVELKRRTDEVARQARKLRRHERLERERALAEQRAILEANSMRERLKEQRRHAAELESLNRRLEDNDRRKDEFIAILGHELRNPLAPLVSGLELLASGNEASRQAAQVVMKRQVDHLTRLVDDLLDVSRVTRGKIELKCSQVNVPMLVKQAIAQVEAVAEARQHQLEVIGGDTQATIEGDEVRLVQVLSNLLGNAVRYTEPGGRVTLHVEAKDEEVVFRVGDSGKGIPPELLPRVFDLFVQGTAGNGGLGIGLTLVERLVRLHGGDVSVSSNGPGTGSVFTVRLPRTMGSVASSSRVEAPSAGREPDSNPLSSRPSSPASNPVPSAPGSEPGQSARRLRIVLIEDNEDARFMMEQMLVMWGHQVRQAGLGEEGLALLQDSPADVAFVDIGLPDIQGYEVARRARASLPQPQPYMVALSGFGQEQDRNRAADAGFDAHLTKPTSVESLDALLSRVARDPTR